MGAVPTAFWFVGRRGAVDLLRWLTCRNAYLANPIRCVACWACLSGATMRSLLFTCLALLGLSACTDDPATSSHSQGLVSNNRLAANRLAANRLAANRLA